jgi:hypothetical protein
MVTNTEVSDPVLSLPSISVDVSSRLAEHALPKGQLPNVDLTVISNDYFQTIQAPLLRGRDFANTDDMNSQQVMIVNQAFAQQYFPGKDVLGKRVKSGMDNGMPGVRCCARLSAW